MARPYLSAGLPALCSIVGLLCLLRGPVRTAYSLSAPQVADARQGLEDDARPISAFQETYELQHDMQIKYYYNSLDKVGMS